MPHLRCLVSPLHVDHIPKPFGMVNPHKFRFGLMGSKAYHVLLTPHEYGITFEEILKEERKGENSDIKTLTVVLIC